jgi:SAM-dependent methyltransferase
VEHWAGFAAPAREAVARAAGIEAGPSVLDVGCGSGELCELAASRGARVSGIEAAAELVEFARRTVPEADLRVGPIEQLPWPDESFDLVTGFNAFQFAADFVVALAEAGRVMRSGGRVAICNWGGSRTAKSTRSRATGRTQAIAPIRPARGGEPGLLEGIARQAGLTPERRRRSRRGRTSFPTGQPSSVPCLRLRPSMALTSLWPSGWSPTRSRRPPNDSSERMAPTGSRTASGT